MMVRCQRCILPDTYPGIVLNEQGICSYCTSFSQPDWPQRERELNAIVDRAREFDGKYQALVPFSGGKDSSYVLYVMSQVYNLRVLAINFDNGFRSPAADKNLASVTTRLGVDLVSLKPAWSLMKKIYAAFIKDAGEFCTVCNAMGYLVILSHIINVLERRDCHPLVAGGWASYLEAMPGVYSFDIKYFHEIVSSAGLASALTASGLIQEQSLALLLNAPDPRTIQHDQRMPVAYVSLPEYLYWDIETITSTLKDKAGWSMPPQSSDNTHFDCTMYPVAKYIERRKYGFSQNTITCSALIRHGQMTRTAALEKVANEISDPPPEFNQFLAALEIPESAVNWNGTWHPQRH